MDIVDFSFLIKEFQKANTKTTADESKENQENEMKNEKEETTKEDSNTIISRTFEINLEENEFILTLNKDNEKIDFLLNDKKSLNTFKTNRTFDEIRRTKCFATDESLDEAFIIMEELINLGKTKLIKENESLIRLVFEDEIRRKTVTSTFDLRKENFTFNDLLGNITSKINSLHSENREKEKEIHRISNELSYLATQNEKFTKENQELLNNFSNLKDNLFTQKSIMDKILEENKSNKSVFSMLLEENQNNKLISKKLIDENKFLNLQIIKLNDENKNMLKAISKLPEFQNKSKIILNSEINLLKEWIGKEFTMELLYSSDIHPKNVRFFHEKCDNIPDTITVVESEYGRRFGGFTKMVWKSCELDEFSRGDGTDFIFSLTKKAMFRNNKNFDQAIWNYANYFPCFGGGCDLQLYYNCFDNNGATTNFQHSYGVGCVLDEDRRTYLAGNNNFKVFRLEIFRLRFD